MHITCPSCDKHYDIPDASIGERGRKVRCAACDHRWHVEPETPHRQPSTDEPDTDRPEAVGFAQAANAHTAENDDLEDEFEADFDRGSDEDDAVRAVLGDLDDEDETEGEDEDDDRHALPDAPPLVGESGPGRTRTSILAVLSWLLLLVVALTLGGLVVARDEVVDLLPESAQVYSALGLPVTRKLGLEIRGIETETLEQDGSPVVVVKGEVHNLTSSEREVPLVVVRLLGEEYQSVEEELVVVEQPLLPAQGMTRFELRIVAPPEEARSFSVAFDALHKG